MGEVFVFTGLWDFCENYDQMAIVLAHDIAHTILDHQAEDLSNQHLEVILAVIIRAFNIVDICYFSVLYRI